MARAHAINYRGKYIGGKKMYGKQGKEGKKSGEAGRYMIFILGTREATATSGFARRASH